LLPHHRWIVHTVVLALALPALLGLLTGPATSAAAALERDIALWVCNSEGNGGPAGPDQSPAQHDGSCILCSVCAAAAGPAPAEPASAFPALSRTPAAKPHPLAAQLRPHPSLLLSGSPPRGPPSLLLI
jgi:hypothetical protein